jgi:acetate kinase
MEFLGIHLNRTKNRNAVGVEADISEDNATCRTLVIPTNEELVIARDTERIINAAAGK